MNRIGRPVLSAFSGTSAKGDETQKKPAKVTSFKPRLLSEEV
jgi:hypothetical protein